MIKIQNLLKERVGSKILSPEKLDKRLLSHLKNKYGIEIDDKLITKGPNRERWDHPQYLTAEVPSETVSQEDWNQFFKSYGYYIADMMDDAWTEFHKLKLYRIDTHKIDPPKYVYHLTPMNKLLKIKNKGLTPRKSSKIYDVDDPRVYFVEDWDAVLQIDSRLANETEVRPPFGNELAVLKIDTEKVNGDFYRDLEVKDNWSVYTRENVPPSAITNWDEYGEELETLKKRN